MPRDEQSNLANWSIQQELKDKQDDQSLKKYSSAHITYKGDVQDCSNYRVIKLISHISEPIWIYAKEVYVEAIHLMRQMIEYYRARKGDLYMVFIDLKIAYNVV